LVGAGPAGFIPAGGPVAHAGHGPAKAGCGRPGCRCPVHALPLPATGSLDGQFRFPRTRRPGPRPWPARPACGRNRDT